MMHPRGWFAVKPMKFSSCHLMHFPYHRKSLYPSLRYGQVNDTNCTSLLCRRIRTPSGGLHPPALPLRLTTHTRLPSEWHIQFQPGRMSRLPAGSTGEKPSMRHPVGARTPISRVRILFPNLLEDRTMTAAVLIGRPAENLILPYWLRQWESNPLSLSHDVRALSARHLSV